MLRFSCNFYPEATKQICFQMLKFEPQFFLFIFTILTLSLFSFFATKTKELPRFPVCLTGGGRFRQVLPVA